MVTDFIHSTPLGFFCCVLTPVIIILLLLQYKTKPHSITASFVLCEDRSYTDLTAFLQNERNVYSIICKLKMMEKMQT